MNKTAVKGMSAVLVLVVLGIAAGMITRRTFVDNTDLKAFVDTNPHVEYCDINYAEDDSLGLVDGDSVESVSDLMADGELVVKVHLDETWNRELYQECVLSKVKVDNVYQGNAEPGEEIYIFEPVDCVGDFMDCTGGYTLMQEETEYVLFLKKLKNAGYGDAEYVYMPQCMTYGKYTYGDSVPAKYIDSQDSDKLPAYSDIRDAEVIILDDEQYDKYCRLKKEVMALR